MKFDWQYRYVSGGTKPDKHGRWALDLSIFVKIDKNLKNYKHLNGVFGKYMPTRVATIKLSKNKIHKFCVTIYMVEGISLVEKTTYSDHIEDLKDMVEKEFINLKNFFKNCR